MGFRKRLSLKRGPRGIILFMIYFLCVMGTLELFGFPHMIEYLLDIGNVLLLVHLIINRKIKRGLKDPLVVIQLIVFAIGIIISFVHFVSPVLVIWSIRNLFRFLVFYLGCISYLRPDDIESIFFDFRYLFYINFGMILFEFLYLGFRDDELGGLFGATQTTNGDLNIFLLITTTFFVVMWEEKKIKNIELISVLTIDVFISAFAELKFFFFEIFAIFLLVFVISSAKRSFGKKIVKWLVIITLALVILAVGMKYMIRLYPQWENFFSIEKIMLEVTRTGGYTNIGDINRFTFLNTINNLIFRNNILERIFGLGLGACEFSDNIKLFMSSFYIKYYYLHYFYFSLSWMYVECGVIGMIGYLLSFVITFIRGIRRIRRINKVDMDKTSYYTVGVVVCFCSILLLIYNQSMRLPTAYLIYMGISLMTIYRNENNSLLSKGNN